MGKKEKCRKSFSKICKIAKEILEPIGPDSYHSFSDL